MNFGDAVREIELYAKGPLRNTKKMKILRVMLLNGIGSIRVDCRIFVQRGSRLYVEPVDLAELPVLHPIA